MLHDSRQKFQRTPALKRACIQLAEPVSLGTYYNYRRLYQRWQGDRNQIAAALRRSTFNQTCMSQDQLHFVDTHIMRFYARNRPIRPSPKTLRKIMQSTLVRTNGLWPDPGLCGDKVPQNLIDELLDPKLPMAAILNNPEKAGLLKPIELPSRSWLYQYLRWFTHQPEHGRAVITARYGQEMWEQEQLIFDTFVRLAMMPLQYVFADHWLVDVFTVDEATRSKINRLTDLAWSPSGDRLAAVAQDINSKEACGIVVLDTTSGETLLTLEGYESAARSLDWSPDGETILTGHEDGAVRMWDARTGAERSTLIGHADVVRDAVFSPDGSRIATASEDGTVRLWDVETSTE